MDEPPQGLTRERVIRDIGERLLLAAEMVLGKLATSIRIKS